MKIRKPCQLERLYGHTHPIREDSPELGFMRAVCAGNVDAALAFFRENKLFGGEKCAVDAPYGRFVGLAGVETFARGWLSRFEARAATVVPFIQTIANGRVALEAVVNFEVDGEINQVPMFVIGDYRTPQTLDELRLYCHYTFVPGLQAYRAPIFPSAHLEAGDPGLLTGAVREYYTALHHSPSVDVERILGCMADDCVFGGYEPWGANAHPATTRAELRRAYEHMATYIPRCVGMRYETIIDDGHTCVIEWVHVASREGQERLGRLTMSGIAAYERNADGLLCSIRISDYAGCEGTIDWSRLPLTLEDARKVNFVERFPSGVGDKPL